MKRKFILGALIFLVGCSHLSEKSQDLWSTFELEKQAKELRANPVLQVTKISSLNRRSERDLARERNIAEDYKRKEEFENPEFTLKISPKKREKPTGYRWKH
ncbi:hypothetical protein AGMMS49949_04800 [Alphaproteobacteria bacterium]|nr:hypothetical protein AGMMS49949_04800 [Alphaproteobacteria bacterium]GHS97229.1 hypothetical protein AGMMS50296_4040 [Alphaproteobacteria bacterium]